MMLLLLTTTYCLYPSLICISFSFLSCHTPSCLPEPRLSHYLGFGNTHTHKKELSYSTPVFAGACDPQMRVYRPQVTDGCSPAPRTISTARTGDRERERERRSKRERACHMEAAHWRETRGCDPTPAHHVQSPDAPRFETYCQRQRDTETVTQTDLSPIHTSNFLVSM